MAAILADFDALREIVVEAEQGEVCDVANDNAPGQIVISGAKGAVDRAVELAKARGAKRAVLLPVSAPFHSRLMGPAADVMASALAEVAVNEPAAPLVCNVLAEPITEPGEIRQRLVEQVTGMVRWTESVRWLVGEGAVTGLAERGAGKVLPGLAQRIAPEATAASAGTPADIDALVAALAGA